MVNPLPKILSIFMHGDRKYQESVFDLPAEDFFLNDILKVRGSLLMRTFCCGDVVVFLLFFLGGVGFWVGAAQVGIVWRLPQANEQCSFLQGVCI